MSHVLVTGGAGFIGSHIVDNHLSKGDKVWVVDNLSTGKMENLKHHPEVRFDQTDLTAFPELNEAVANAKFIYHMCATVGVFNVLNNPSQTLSNNFQTFEVLLQAMKKTSTKARLLLASSSSVYVHSDVDKEGALHEEADLKFPSGNFLYESYSASKMINEMQALSYAHSFGVRCVIARIFNTIGLRQTGRYGMVVPRFIEQALNEEPLTVFGDGSQTRSFCNVHDICRGLELLLKNPGTDSQIFNIGNNSEITILDLSRLVLKLTKSPSTIKFVPYKTAYGVEYQDIKQRRPSLDKIEKSVGYRPEWTLEQTIIEIFNSKHH